MCLHFKGVWFIKMCCNCFEKGESPVLEMYYVSLSLAMFSPLWIGWKCFTLCKHAIDNREIRMWQTGHTFLWSIQKTNTPQYSCYVTLFLIQYECWDPLFLLWYISVDKFILFFGFQFAHSFPCIHSILFQGN